ncbi:MAG TPA: twin-arginine translocation signal domain-containing protein [Blastocatellia bacterium]|nr:twin-arginine translocation signal domain-containing protein [Blastocatellia bacterium]
MKRHLVPGVCPSTPVQGITPGAERVSRAELSRRGFLQTVALASAGAGLIHSGPTRASAATELPPATRPAAPLNAPGTGVDMGEVTLDGLMLTYFCAAPAFSSSTFTFGRNFSTTFTLKLPQSPAIVLTGTVPSDDPVLLKDHIQRTSPGVKDAIILQPELQELPGKLSKFSSKRASSSIQFYGLSNPRLRFSGTPDNLRFCFADTGQQSFDLAASVSAETASSMLSQYITDPAKLFPPRYYWVDVVGGARDVTFDFGLPSKLLSRNGATATVTAKIVHQSGFSSGQLQQAFAAGNGLEITYHSAQELPSSNLMALQATLGESNQTRIYIDRVFKTFII